MQHIWTAWPDRLIYDTQYTVLFAYLQHEIKIFFRIWQFIIKAAWMIDDFQLVTQRILDGEELTPFIETVQCVMGKEGQAFNADAFLIHPVDGKSEPYRTNFSSSLGDCGVDINAVDKYAR